MCLVLTSMVFLFFFVSLFFLCGGKKNDTKRTEWKTGFIRPINFFLPLYKCKEKDTKHPRIWCATPRAYQLPHFMRRWCFCRVHTIRHTWGWGGMDPFTKGAGFHERLMWSIIISELFRLCIFFCIIIFLPIWYDCAALEVFYKGSSLKFASQWLRNVMQCIRLGGKTLLKRQKASEPSPRRWQFEGSNA